MGLKVGQLTVDCKDPDKLAGFWQEALGWKQAGRWEHEDEDMLEVEIESHDGSGFNILFLTDHEEKRVKNRLHLDLVPDDQAAEVTRLEKLGASKADIGQKDVPWVVMADPEGNEFCVLRPQNPSEG